MNRTALRGLLILAGAFVLCFAVFASQGPPRAAGGAPSDSAFLATLAAGGINAAYGAASAYWLAAAMSGFALIAALRLGRIWDGGRIVKDQT